MLQSSVIDVIAEQNYKEFLLSVYYNLGLSRDLRGLLWCI